MPKQRIDEIIWKDWEIVSVLGKGSYGVVYKAKKNSLGNTLFSAVKHMTIPKDNAEIKTLKHEGMSGPEIEQYYKEIVEGISKEILLMENLKGNTNIVSIEDFKIIKKEKDIGWDVLIRMEILDDLNNYFNGKSGPITDIIDVGIDICSSLECCEKINIIHRDIKPENIFVNKFGNFKLGDFGIAREYAQSNFNMSRRGTPYYVAPEVNEGKYYDKTVDIYSLGIVLYRLLNMNRLPFFPTQGSVTLSQRNRALALRLTGEPLDDPINSNEELSRVIKKACEKNPEDRYNSPTEFKEALKNVKNNLICSEDIPAYDFTEKNAEDDFDAIKGSTYDLSSEAVNNDSENKNFVSLNRKKNFICVCSLAVLLIAIALTFAVKGNSAKSDNSSIAGTLDSELTETTVTLKAVENEVVYKETDSEESSKANEKEITKLQTTTEQSSSKATTAKAAAKKTTTKKKTTKKETTTKKKATKKKTTSAKTTTKKTTASTTTAVPVGTVSGLSVVKSGSNIRATWSSVSNATEYIVVCSGPDGYSSSQTTKLKSAQFRISSSGTYSVTVTPVSSNGTYGGSASASCTI